MKLFKRTHITVIISSEFVIWLKCRNWAKIMIFLLWQVFYLFIYLDIFLVTFFFKKYFFLVAQVKQQLAIHLSYYWEKHDLLVITIASYRLKDQDCHTFLTIMVIIYTLMIRYYHFFFLLWELISSVVNEKFNSRIALLAINTILQMTTWTTSSKLLRSSH